MKTNEIVHFGPVNVMLDSGAFSAWSKGEEITVEEYNKFLQNHGDLFDTIVGLDVIPGSRGKKLDAVADEVADETFKNYLFLKKRGIDNIPVYHCGEDLKHLDRILDSGAEYIGIGGIASLSTSIRDAFLRNVFSKLVNKDGYPIIKTHGFGLTGFNLVRKFPWYSVDSTSFVTKASFGKIIVPKYPLAHKGIFEPDYSENPIIVNLTGGTKDTNKMFMDTESELFQECVRDFIENKVGVSLVEARYYSYIRVQVVAYCFKKMFETFKYKPFGDPNPLLQQGNLQRIRWQHKRIYFAVSSLDMRHYSHALNAIGAPDRLLSYAIIRDRGFSRKRMKRYVKKGNDKDYAKKPVSPTGEKVAYKNFRSVELANRMEKYNGS